MSVIPLSQMLRSGAHRRLLLFPRGNENAKEDFVAVYLNFPEAPFTPHQLCPDAHFEIVVVNQKEESMSIRLGLGFPS